ncbi:MAG: tetratricopeptide repeat protein [Sedimentisphaerales bacterium]|nr:tetratricopeptide repeat protein [Sedimentisphaerales bacterium]
MDDIARFTRLLVLLLIAAAAGCGRVRPQAVQSDAGPPAESAAPLGRVAPQELNEDLTSLQLERMFVTGAEIPWAAFWRDADPNRIPPAADTTMSTTALATSPSAAPDRRQARKLYLAARRLIARQRYESALDPLLRAAELDPNSPAIQEQLARSYYHLSNTDAAAQAARRTWRLDPNNIIAHQILGQLYSDQGDLPRAAVWFHRALGCPAARRENPVTPVLHLQLARTLMEMDYLTAAAQQYESAYTLLHAQRKYAQSTQTMEQLLRQVHLPLLTMVSLYVRSGQMQQAYDSLRRAQEYFPPQADVVRAFVLSLADQRIALHVRFRQVLVFCRYALTQQKSADPILEMFYQACRAMAKHDGYLEVLARWADPQAFGDLSPLLTRREYAYGLMLAGEIENAERILQERLAAADVPDAALLRRDLARLCRQRRNPAEMIRQYGAYLEGRPDQADQIVAEALAAADDLAVELPAERAANQTADEPDESTADRPDPDPSSADTGYGALYLWGKLALQRKRQELAEHYFNQAVERAASFEPAYRCLIELYLQQRRYPLVLQTLEQMPPEILSPTECGWYAGQACLGLNQLPQAAAHFQAVLSGGIPDAGGIPQRQAYIALAEVFLRDRQYPRAESILLQASDRWPAAPDVYGQLMLLYALWSGVSGQSEGFYQAAQNRTWRYLDEIRSRLEPSEIRPAAAEPEPAAFYGRIITAIRDTYQGHQPSNRLLALLLARLYWQAGQPDQALAQIDQAITEFPNDPTALIQAAHWHQQQGDFSRAGRLWYQIWRQDPSRIFRLNQALAALDRGGQADEALDLLQQHLTEPVCQNPDAVRTLHKQAARLLAISRRYREGIELFSLWRRRLADDRSAEQSDASNLDPNALALETTVRGRLIWLFTQAGQYEQAFADLEPYYDDAPDAGDLPALHLLRSLQARLRLDQADRYARQLLARRPDSLPLRLQSYLIEIQLGRQDQVLAAARQWLSDQPDRKERRRVLIFLCRWIGDDTQALEQLRQAQQAHPDEPEWPLEQAEILRLQQQYDQAEQVLAVLFGNSRWFSLWLAAQVEIDIAQSDCARALARIASAVAADSPSEQIEQVKTQILASCGRRDEVIERMESFLRDHPKDVARRLWYSNYLADIGRPAESIRQLETLCELYPRDAGIQNNLGYSLLAADGDPNRVHSLLQASLDLEPENGPTLDSLGWFYYKRGQFDRAREYLCQAAATMALPDPEVWDHLGDVSYRLDRRSQAGQYWQQALNACRRQSGDQPRQLELRGRIETKMRQLADGREVTAVAAYHSSEHKE